MKGQSLTMAEGRGISDDWQDESLEKGVSRPIAELMKRAKALRFYGLMGKRSGANKSFQADKRNKGEMFVGLMGRSISGDNSLTRIKPSATILEKPHKQGSSEDLVQILY
ncbi:uncharacterized protein si:ch211-131k2.2 isoform X2 [Betta splendens]|uniref:Uncharacterized protein si:ch211-131k2.2 isoform X2 n=1 Tax=Betta splendens TaxID=158456 RepID=A0A9W2XEX0_BETSP|nr:uncharacterized protein si:ch211-131k2.2 isoform X2 [Betta splendens]